MENMEWEVMLIPKDPADNKPRQLKVVSFDKTAKTITVKYAGAYSGVYGFTIKELTTQTTISAAKRFL